MITTNVEKILRLKAEAEVAMQTFNDVLKEINTMGFNAQVQPNYTLYIFRQSVTEEDGETSHIKKQIVTREAYGEICKQPEVKTPAQLSAVNN